MSRFTRLYYIVAGLTLAGAACLPWLVPLSYRARGLAPALATAGTDAAFRAHLATLALRRQFMLGLLGLALALVVLSLVALGRRACGDATLPWPLLLGTATGATALALVALGGMLAGGCC